MYFSKQINMCLKIKKVCLEITLYLPISFVGPWFNCLNKSIWLTARFYKVLPGNKGNNCFLFRSVPSTCKLLRDSCFFNSSNKTIFWVLLELIKSLKNISYPQRILLAQVLKHSIKELFPCHLLTPLIEILLETEMLCLRKTSQN